MLVKQASLSEWCMTDLNHMEAAPCGVNPHSVIWKKGVSCAAPKQACQLGA